MFIWLTERPGENYESDDELFAWFNCLTGDSFTIFKRRHGWSQVLFDAYFQEYDDGGRLETCCPVSNESGLFHFIGWYWGNGNLWQLYE